MNKKIIYEFTNEDYELLSRPIPINPCSTCVNTWCSDCTEEHIYKSIMKSYKDANIIEFAEKISAIQKAIRELNKNKKLVKELISELPEELQKNVKFHDKER